MLAEYQKPQWQCAATAKGGLTFKEALQSETRCRQEVLNKFSKFHLKKLLESIHHSKFNDAGELIYCLK